jgi:hypothetical protein
MPLLGAAYGSAHIEDVYVQLRTYLDELRSHNAGSLSGQITQAILAKALRISVAGTLVLTVLDHTEFKLGDEMGVEVSFSRGDDVTPALVAAGGASDECVRAAEQGRPIG